MKKIIEVKNIIKSYSATHKNILNKVNLSIYENEFITIGGESGSGKSTLLRILSLLDPHFKGEYYFHSCLVNQKNTTEIENFRQNYLGVIFQDFNLINRYTTYRNLELALIPIKVPFNQRKDKIESIINKVNLPLSILNRTPEELSGGQRQRVAIARALLSNPSIIVADEPTGSLDDENALEILRLLLSLNTTLIIATHDARIAKISDRHIHVYNGELHVT